VGVCFIRMMMSGFSLYCVEDIIVWKCRFDCIVVYGDCFVISFIVVVMSRLLMMK